MTQETSTSTSANAVWLALGVIVLAQIQMAFNVNALPVSIGPIVDEFSSPATSVGTALVVYSLFVAAFVMLGAKIGKMFGERLVFQVSVLIHGLAMGIMAFSSNVDMMNNAQALAGLAAAALVPTLVVLIATNYQGKQQAQALGVLAGAPAMAGAVAFFIAGFLATVLSWRLSFGLLAVLSIVVFVLSFRLKPIPRQRGIVIDVVGTVLAALAVSLISLGFNNLNTWGMVLANPAAPFTVLGLSPAPFMIVLGVVFVQAFLSWSHKRVADGTMPLLSLEVMDSPQERAAIYTLLVISALGPAVNFLIPLYMQIVQDRTSLQTAVAVVPYTLAIFTAAVFVIRLYDRLSARQIGAVAFAVVAIGLALLGVTIENDWSTPMVILGLLIVGIGEGALVTLLFNVLVTASPKELAGDVGALRGTVNNLSTALGTAIAGVMSIMLLSLIITSSLADNPTIPPQLISQVNLNNVNFISNDQLLEVMANTTATPEQVEEAVRINQEARLQALKDSFLILAGIALLAIVPSLWLPRHTTREVEA